MHLPVGLPDWIGYGGQVYHCVAAPGNLFADEAKQEVKRQVRGLRRALNALNAAVLGMTSQRFGRRSDQDAQKRHDPGLLLTFPIHHYQDTFDAD
jgi:hypothetical protein